MEGKFLPESWVAAGATRLSAGCWEETMNSELGRSMGSTKIFPFIGSLEQVDGTKSTCSTSQSLVLVGLTDEGPFL